MLRFSFALVVAVVLLGGSASASQRPLAVSVTAGVDHTCTLTRAGAVRCWGYNGHDELGDGRGDGQNSAVPVGVQGLSGGVTAISAGGRHTCAVQRGGVLCWGANYSGALGDGTDERRPAPVRVVGLGSGVTSVAGGIDHSCALTSAGAVECWGDNEGGEVGDGTTMNRLTPVGVVGLGGGVEAIAAQALHSCALTVTGGVKCWGRGYGATPVDLPGLTSGVMAITPNCALTSAGGVKCWSAPPLVVTGVPGLENVVALATSGLHGCALLTGGTVKCWGLNDHGQLGDGTKNDHPSPVRVARLRKGIVAIGVGAFYSCAVSRAGGIQCWGRNSAGELGDGTSVDRLRPSGVAGFGLAASLAITSRAVQVDARGLARVVVRCGVPVACRGALVLERRSAILGQRSFSVTGGHRQVVAVRISARAFELLSRARRLRAVARARFRQPDDGVTTVTRVLTLAAPAR